MQDHRVVEEDPCPVPDNFLGEVYRSSAHGLGELVATVAPNIRAMLALYCFRRGHLNSIGLAIAATCDEDDLIIQGGKAGAALFAMSREAAGSAPVHSSGRRKITLASGPLRTFAPDAVDDAVEALEA